MVDERRNLDYGRDDALGDDDRIATDSSELTEGVGGLAEIDADTDDEGEVNPEASTYGAP